MINYIKQLELFFIFLYPKCSKINTLFFQALAESENLVSTQGSFSDGGGIVVVACGERETDDRESES